MSETYRAGIDVGSTTVKLVVLDSEDRTIFSDYRRHHAHIRGALAELLREAQDELGPMRLAVKVTGSGALGLADALNVGFEQEVACAAAALRKIAPQTDVAIELGGEDAKIIYLTGGLEQRMNGVCAGGTGSFIDQMAALLQTDAAGLNDEASRYQQIYPIAARCGVFAKSDIQPLINEGASRPDLAASVFQAVVNQTISGLACGKPIRGNVAFLGGPLHFLPELKKAFARTLSLTSEQTIDPENSHLFAAMGAAMKAAGAADIPASALIAVLSEDTVHDAVPNRLDPLFSGEADYDAFCRRHERAQVRREALAEYHGNCFLGIDAGSTTTKMVLIGEDGQLLFSYYVPNAGDPIVAVQNAFAKLAAEMPDDARIVRSCATGYGESLMQTAFSLDEGEVETVAHCTAAVFFDPEVDCVLDIGGQDMKCIRLKHGAVDNILLNEACSSGCGSFIENFAVSLGRDVETFASEALYAENPVDLGTRCTVFMNSNVKQAQKQGSTVSDISAGLAYSVVKNALYKVIKLANPSEIGSHVVVQGGTFHNEAVLRAFERITGIEAVRPDISGLMGAFGAALLARNHYTGQETTTLSADEVRDLTYTTTTANCAGCSNQCILTVNRFGGGRRYVTGNRCERGSVEGGGESAPNVAAYKLERIFQYSPVENPTRGEIGIPRVLNMYENYPFWATFFGRLGFRVVLSPLSDRTLFELGMESIPSESECYPAKLAHGHVEWLVRQGVKNIFHPCVFFEHQETGSAQNHYNCPIVVSYPENLKNNVEAVTDGDVHYIRPFMAFTNEKTVADRMVRVCRDEWGIPEREVRKAVHAAWQEQQNAKADIRREGERAITWMEENGRHGIVLAGRPYHMDPEINHGIPEMIASYGLAVLTEDSLPVDFEPERPMRATDQWVYHSRLYTAAEYVSRRNDMELVQLNSFGCGLDAVTTDQVCEILENNGKLYTMLKIDEVNSLGAARIRVRSLLAAIEQRGENAAAPAATNRYKRTEFTREMRKAGYTLIAPQMSPDHFDILEPVCRSIGYNAVILDNDDRSAIDVGLRFVNNDACFPAIVTTGQIMEAVLSGRYDTDKLAIVMSQTGGCCRASNYVGFIRRALDKAGLSHIPVVSLNVNGMEKNSGFQPGVGLLPAMARTLIYGDLISRCVCRVRPYEKVPGSANALRDEWKAICVESLTDRRSKWNFRNVCYGIVDAFDNLPIYEDMRKPRVAVVGEILVRYMPLANNHLVELLESEGAEAVVSDVMDFMNYAEYGESYRYENLGTKRSAAALSRVVLRGIAFFRRHAIRALEQSRRFEAPVPIDRVAELAKPFLSIGNQYGEGWALAGEMASHLSNGVPNIVCAQPFGCLPNHVVGKGVIKSLKKRYPQANIVAVNYDPGASEVNQLNRIKLMLSVARDGMDMAEPAGC